MRKSRHEPHEEGTDRWLLTYADMITLLMALFIMLYSMSVVNLSQFRQAAVSIRSGFGGVVKGQGTSPAKGSEMSLEDKTEMRGEVAGVSWQVLKPLVDYIEKHKEHSAQIGEDERGLIITMRSDSMLFDPSSARIRRNALPLLDEIAKMLKQVDNLVQIEGHTCDLPPRGQNYPTNWELSTARATNVLRYLVEEKGLNGWRFSAAGYGSVRPTAQNTTDANRRKNRRVEIIVLRPDTDQQWNPGKKPKRITDPSSS